MIKLWDISNLNEIKLLNTLKMHQGAVLVVKFNQNGLLASGSDDKSVIIWNGNSVYKVLNNHSSDVCDLRFSGDLLATCGFDSKVYIYSNFELIHVINESSIIKGIEWDPVGEYFSYQSEKALKIFRVKDWKLEKDYEIQGGDSFFKRFSWSPDGEVVVCDSGGGVCMAISRNWDSNVTRLVGHESSIEVLKFHPKIFKDGKEHAIVAMGTQDGSLSVWNTSNPRAMVVVNQLFNHSVLDACWSSTNDGGDSHLWACSYDGSVGICVFDASEIGRGQDVDPGTPLLTTERISRIRDKYGEWGEKFCQ